MECLQGFVSLWLSCSSTSKGPAKDWNSQTFCFCKFQKSSFFEVRNFLEITGFFKLVKFFWKKFGNNFLFLGQKTLWFPKIPNLPKFWNLFYSKLSKNYEKMMTNSNFNFQSSGLLFSVQSIQCFRERVCYYSTCSSRQFHQHSTYSFYSRRSQTCKKRQSNQHCHFKLLGSASVKAVCRTLMKSNPGEWYRLCACTVNIGPPLYIQPVHNISRILRTDRYHVLANSLFVKVYVY